MVLGGKTNFFLGKLWFWVEKPTLSYGKQKTPKNTSFGKLYGQTPKRCVCFVFPRKELVFGGKTIFLPRKKWFWTKKQTFSSEKMLLCKKPTSSEENDGFGRKD